MAQRTVITMVDDMDGYEGQDVQRVFFSLDGGEYEIDLSEFNRHTLAAALEPFVKAARPARVSKVKRARTPKEAAVSAEIRSWARENGIALSARGRIPASVRADYEARTQVRS